MPSTFLQKAAHLLGALAIALATSHALAQTAPPGRVARLSLMEGAVSYAPADSDDWSPAEFNRPLTSGDRLQTAPGARAELHSGSTAMRINGQTALEISEQDDNNTRLTLTQGSLALRVRQLYPGETLEVNTPNLAFTASQPGEYRLDVDVRSGTTGVTVRSGSAVVYGENGISRTLGSQQQARYFDRQLGQEEIRANLQRDTFDLWSYTRDQAEDQSQSARYVSREVIGYQQLDGHGDWRTDSEYGAVWFPRVAVGQWAPYQNGQWRWIAPWGWTWVDNAPWGFAPFHYGRWAQFGAQWGWVPGARQQRPSYAPALVQFDGNNRFDQDRRRPPQGNWTPLAPGQTWRPQYPQFQRPNDNVNNRPQQPGWNRAPRPGDNRPFDNGPTRVEPMVQPPPQAIWPQQAIPHPRPELRMQDAPRNHGELEQRGQMQRQQQIDRERQQQEQNRNQMQMQQQQAQREQVQREQVQRQREASQQQMQQQQQLQFQQQMRDQQNRQQQQQRDAQAQQQQQDRQRMEQARPAQRPQGQETPPDPLDPRRRLFMPGQRPGDSERR